VWLDTPEARAALQFMVDTIGSISPPGVTTYVEEDTRSIFQNGRAVFLRNWMYVRNLVNNSQSEVRGHLGFAPMVHSPGNTSAATLGGWGFAVSSRTAHPEAAWNFVKFITSAEQAIEVYEANGRIPARKSLVPEEFRAIVQTARFRPRIPEYPQASDILQRWLSAALSRAVSPEEALQNAARETRALLGS
jgi:multiple sugar transport system substrate-binding protein